MNGLQFDAKRMERLEESLRMTGRSRVPERAKQVKRSLSPQPRFEPRKRACVPAAIVDRPPPRRIFSPSVTVVRASTPEERRVVQLGSADESVNEPVKRRRTRAETRRMASKWVDLSALDLDGLLDELNHSGWLETDQEVWWSSEPADGLDVGSAQSQVKITSRGEFTEAIWDSLTSRFPDYCDVGSAGDAGVPDGPAPSFTIVIRDKKIEQEVQEELVPTGEDMKTFTLPIRCR